MKPEYITVQVGKHRMQLEKNAGGIQKSLRGMHKHGKEREPALIHILREEVKQGMVCMDLGANVGYITLLLCDLVGENGKVFAVEPDPKNYKLLNRNVSLNLYRERVQHLKIGISNKPRS